MQPLSNAVTGKSYTIKWMFGLPEVVSAIRSYDIEEGSEILVVQNCSNGLIIGSNHRRLMISRDAAARIQV